MTKLRHVVAGVTVLGVLGLSCGLERRAEAQIPGLPAEPLKAFGQLVYPVYEGWYEHADGGYVFLIGYFNMNTEQALDIPVGEDNYLAPGPADQGQPTHFRPGRGWGVFTVRVGPEYVDFQNQKLRWTLVANGQEMTVPFHTDPQWYVEPFLDAANGNRPPDLRFGEGGSSVGGPPVGVAHTLTTEVGMPTALELETSDVVPASMGSRASRRRPALTLRWEKFRGPGDVVFEPAEHRFEESATQRPVSTATFSAPGEYLLRVEAQDDTGPGGSGSQCCWTSAHVRVQVRPAPADSTGG